MWVPYFQKPNVIRPLSYRWYKVPAHTQMFLLVLPLKMNLGCFVRSSVITQPCLGQQRLVRQAKGQAKSTFGSTGRCPQSNGS